MRLRTMNMLSNISFLILGMAIMNVFNQPYSGGLDEYTSNTILPNESLHRFLSLSSSSSSNFYYSSLSNDNNDVEILQQKLRTCEDQQQKQQDEQQSSSSSSSLLQQIAPMIFPMNARTGMIDFDHDITSVIIDIGARESDYLWTLEHVKSKNVALILIDPISESIDPLTASVITNKLTHQVYTIRAAIGSTNTISGFHLGRRPSCGSILQTTPGGATGCAKTTDIVPIVTFTLESLIQLILPNEQLSSVHLKVDAEGADLIVLKSAGETIKLLDTVIIECEDDDTPIGIRENGCKLSNAVEYMKSIGFTTEWTMQGKERGNLMGYNEDKMKKLIQEESISSTSTSEVSGGRSSEPQQLQQRQHRGSNGGGGIGGDNGGLHIPIFLLTRGTARNRVLAFGEWYATIAQRIRAIKTNKKDITTNNKEISTRATTGIHEIHGGGGGGDASTTSTTATATTLSSSSSYSYPLRDEIQHQIRKHREQQEREQGSFQPPYYNNNNNNHENDNYNENEKRNDFHNFQFSGRIDETTSPEEYNI